MPFLAGMGTILVGFVLGVILMTQDHLIIGLAVLIATLPLGFAVWIKASDRY